MSLQTYDITDPIKKEAKRINQKVDDILGIKRTDNILNKQSFLLELQNKNLNQQLDELQDIESQVATKSSLIRKNQRAYRLKSMKIHLLLVFFTVMAFLVFPLIAFLSGYLGFMTFIGIVTVVLVLYFIYTFYQLDTLNIKTFAKPAINELEEVGDAIYNEGKRLEKEWVNFISEECECPEEEEDEEADEETSAIPLSVPHDIPDNQGKYYYDGSAPQQRIVPGARKQACRSKNKFRIDWNVAPDYGNRSTGRFTPGPTWKPKQFGLPKSRIHEGFNNQAKVFETKEFTTSFNKKCPTGSRVATLKDLAEDLKNGHMQCPSHNLHWGWTDTSNTTYSNFNAGKSNLNQSITRCGPKGHVSMTLRPASDKYPTFCVNTEQISIPAEQIAIPAQQLVTPAQQLVTPTQQLVTPTQQLVTPTQRLVTPAQTLVTPAQRLMTPAQQLVTPAQRLMTPAQQLVTPAQQLVTPAQQLVIATGKIFMTSQKTKRCPTKSRMTTRGDMQDDLNQGIVHSEWGWGSENDLIKSNEEEGVISKVPEEEYSSYCTIEPFSFKRVSGSALGSLTQCGFCRPDRPYPGKYGKKCNKHFPGRKEKVRHCKDCQECNADPKTCQKDCRDWSWAVGL